MTAHVLALDLGTGGCKASVWSADGHCLAEEVATYPTLHPRPGRNEQRPRDWWDAVVTAGRAVLARHSRIDGIALSGQSLGALLLDAGGELVADHTPIWSDARAGAEAAEFFARVPEETWYRRTGNGFPAPLYPLFTAGWYRRHAPDAWARTRSLVGSKDWINLRLTGELATDHTYASGSGAYDLRARRYAPDLLAAADLDPGLLPEAREATDRVGVLQPSPAAALGLPAGIPVLTGAVDNACMALGSRGTRAGRIYAALGSSSWITVTATEPVIDPATRPYVFAHAVPGHFISALSTFSSGSSMTWLRDTVAPAVPITDLLDEACTAPRLARGALMLPTLVGGTPAEGGPDARGVLLGLDLGHGRADLFRAGMEGIAFTLRRSLETMRRLVPCDAELLVSGGGSRHDGWNQIYADVLDTALVRTTVDQQAATLGAAAIGFVGLGAWSDFERADEAHDLLSRYTPTEPARTAYTAAHLRFDDALATLAALQNRRPVPDPEPPLAEENA